MSRALLTVILLSVATAALAAPPTVTALKASAPPTLDGKFDDPVWQTGEWYTNFTLLGEGDRPATAQTRFKVAFDEANLYFAVELDEPHMDKLQTTVTNRDGFVYSDDCAEFMICPNSARQDYYHFIVNPLGTLYDAERRQGGHVGTADWNADWRAVIGKFERGWTVEVAIPFVELGLTAESRGDWALNVARERQAHTQELSSFTEGRGGFHQPNYYATLKLPGADLGRYMWALRDPYDVVVRQEADQLSYQGKIHLTNQTGGFWFLQLRPELISASGRSAGKAVSEGFDNTQGRELAFSVPVKEQGPQTLRLRLVDRRRPSQVLYVRSVPITVTYTPLSIDITRPFYRDSIYATQKIDQIEATVTSALGSEQMRGLRLAAALYVRDAEGRPTGEPVTRATNQAAVATAQVRLPAATLAVGDYLLVARLVDGAQKVVAEAQKRLRKLPPPTSGHEWRFDENLVLLRDGKPFQVFGWFSHPPEEFKAADGYTALQSYSKEYFSDEVVREWLDKVVQAGAVATFSPYSRPFMNRGEDMKRPLNDDERQELRRRVLALRDHPGLLAWYMFDEPELVPVLPQRAQEIYEIVAETDPYHPCIMLNDTIDGIYKYAAGGDILMPDPYPLFLKGALAAREIEKTSQFIKAIKPAGGGRKAAWVTPQGFNYGDYGLAGNRGPTLTELRNQNYQSVIYGVRGFLWYTYGQYHNYPDLNLGMPFLAKEMRDLQDAVQAPEIEGGVTVQAPHAQHIHTAVRRVGNDWYLFAVNTATEPQTASFTLPGAPGVLHVVSEGRQVTLQGGTFSDRFETYGAHIYTSRADLAGREAMAGVQAAIDRANAARKRPGNLAFEDSNVRVKVSSGAPYSNNPERVVDGILSHMGWTARDPKAGEWLSLIWPAEITAGRVVVYSPTLAEVEVQAGPGAEGPWQTVGTLKVTAEGRLEGTFTPTKFTALRLVATQTLSKEMRPSLQEVEVYAK
jgi:hypothetical protein